ncbi:MAG: GAF domain-containing protein [Oscillospiraceae bacterium]
MNQIHEIYNQDKLKFYALLCAKVKAFTENEKNYIPNLANASAFIYEYMQNLNWAGFYLINGTQLVLGPFQGKPACIRIDMGKGVCGTAALTQSTQLVEDVHKFPGHIACDCASNSEIVIPIHYKGKVVAVLDIDSPILSRFDQIDKQGLENLVKILEQSCDFSLPVINF